MFALTLPDDTIAWDLLTAADWIDEDKTAALRFLVKEVQTILTKQGLINLLVIKLFDVGNVTDNEVFRVKSEDGVEEINTEFHGRQVQRVCVFVPPIYGLQPAVG